MGSKKGLTRPLLLSGSGHDYGAFGNDYGAVVKTEKGPVLSYHDITYSVRVRGSGLVCLAQYETKQILKGVSGVFKPGMNAIIGPSGSGKTTLLDILAGRKETANMTGMILLDDNNLPPDFNCMSGYVIQDDMMMGTLTVRENINFSAMLRLPQATSEEERQRAVDIILSDLGIAHVSNSRVGSEFSRGISGGERKQTSVGMEMVLSPDVLFLDEPTTGLDAFTARQVMELVHKLSRRGKTIICAIHQPRYSIFKLFDTVTLLGNGETMYHGPRPKALTYFAQLGYVSGKHENPADFLLDTVQSVLVTEATDIAKQGPSLAEQFQTSKHAEVLQEDLAAIQNRYRAKAAGSVTSASEGSGFPTDRLFQFATIMKRAFLNLLRNPTTSVGKMASAIIIGLFVGGAYFNIGDEPNTAVQNRVGAMFYIGVNMVFSNIPGIELFIAQRALFKHEALSGYYRVLPYFLARVAIDVMLFRIFPTVMFCTITYNMIGFGGPFKNFQFFLLVVVLSSLVGSALAFFISAMISHHSTAAAVMTSTVGAMAAFTGLLVNLKHMTKLFRWMQWGSIVRFTMEGLEIIALEGDRYCYGKINGTCPSGPETVLGNTYIKNQGFHLDSKWIDVGALLSYTVVFLTLAYLRLRFMKKTK